MNIDIFVIVHHSYGLSLELQNSLWMDDGLLEKKFRDDPHAPRKSDIVRNASHGGKADAKKKAKAKGGYRTSSKGKKKINKRQKSDNEMVASELDDVSCMKKEQSNTTNAGYGMTRLCLD